MALSSRRLDTGRAAALEEHVAGCADCSAWLREQRTVSAALDLWDAPPVSADFDRRLYRRIEQEVPWWDFLVRPFRPVFGAQWAPVAVAAALMVAVGLWVERPGETPAIPAKAQIEALPPEQAADALQEMQVMQDFSNLIQPDAADPRM